MVLCRSAHTRNKEGGTRNSPSHTSFRPIFRDTQPTAFPRAHGIGVRRFKMDVARFAATRRVHGAGGDQERVVGHGAERAERHALKAESEPAAHVACPNDHRAVDERLAPCHIAIVHVRNWDAKLVLGRRLVHEIALDVVG